MKTPSIAFAFLLIASLCSSAPTKLAIAGLTHTHVHWIFESAKNGEFEIVGISEPNRELAQRYSKQHGFSMDLVYDDLASMLAATRPDGLTAFGSIREHLEVVQTAAPLGIHVMVEKPLAVSLEHARQMKSIAEKHGIHLLTNYETTWYPTNHKAYELLKEGAVGDLRKVIINDGHRGPKKLGINSEFLDWLLDPVENGGGAITDFGCYGANLMTWLTNGERPLSVTAITQQL
ncbi:Gfo/Idh/MocA family protein [Pelagicoccus mobilis]|uniref:Gfo/Idh/MocA family oxidoreductase n=1 Tax=Pelagicoccus mobilis TaxID=415221 RepID=A0A934RXR7_9BACT|nr:Gfo/Idh/MocA family oxidoreductase [Pelagicoccus mobilis]MBK1876766.1 Gfo/Idh/MocA family oxidoreductase [Pelagicoccus mobilis]